MRVINGAPRWMRRLANCTHKTTTEIYNKVMWNVLLTFAPSIEDGHKKISNIECKGIKLIKFIVLGFAKRFAHHFFLQTWFCSLYHHIITSSYIRSHIALSRVFAHHQHLLAADQRRRVLTVARRNAHIYLIVYSQWEKLKEFCARRNTISSLSESLKVWRPYVYNLHSIAWIFLGYQHIRTRRRSIRREKF